MPKVKVPTSEFNIAELEEADYNESDDFESYDGELPPSDTVLTGYIKSMWWTMTGSNKRMFKILFVAADNEEDEAEFDGLPIWDNPFFSPDGKFRWKPFIDNFGVTLTDIQKKLYLEPEENDHPRFGSVVERVGTLVPGGDTAWARVLTKIGFDQEGNRRVEIKKWLPLEDEDEIVDEEEPEDEEEPPEDPEDYDDSDDSDEEEEDEDYEEEDEEEDEEEEEPEPPKRGRRPAPAAAKAAAKPGASPGASAKARAAKTAPARGGRAAAAPARGAKPAATRGTRTTTTKPASATRGRRTAQPPQKEPPF
jgi:hypothetical protein